MFSKVWSSAVLVLAVLHQVSAHAAVSPALGVAGTPVRNNVKRPSTANPCGAGVSIANTINTSTAVSANAAGTFTATAINFNGGADGSRKFTAKVDATGKGTSFVAMTITTNGDAAPTNVGTQNLVATLPAGTKCTGGTTGNKCLVSFTSTAGFGNCVVVSQAAAAGTAATAAAGTAAAGTAAAGTAAAGTAAAGTAATTTTTKTTGKTRKNKAKKVAGTRAARYLMAELAELEARAEEGVEVVKRSVSSWLWA